MTGIPWYSGPEQRRRRRIAGLTLGRLAQLSGVSVTHLSQIETGGTEASPRQPSPESAARIAAALSCSIEDLMLPVKVG